ncbi:hypothetical protein SAMN04487785_10635 [Dyella jiangningensis]|uniref:hypothetical protein n=1 Tax=Dyella sp. AtDHG13 TaxID=1938897 RepID=UPI00088174D3|nr:hypothetical protein [Dyella sp. AtDHG13]PXV59115.1 hypothetical protein BDW41_104160 [Dyella sp. AtDHG13]SDK22548.1 hypothetical protein SAMN04487785_10635 [Dyella jiangningensis]
MSAANGSNLGARLSQMELWPAWARWGALTVAYGLLAASFWLMIRDGQLMKLLGLAVFAVGLPFLVYLGRAVGRERCRAADRRYVREFMPAMLVYMVVMLYAWPLQKGMAPGALKTALVLSPMLPIGWVIVACIRHVLASDELERRQHLEAIAISASVVGVVSMALGFLGAAKIFVLDGTFVLLFVYPALCLVYGAVRGYLVWRARRE